MFRTADLGPGRMLSLAVQLPLAGQLPNAYKTRNFRARLRVALVQLALRRAERTRARVCV